MTSAILQSAVSCVKGLQRDVIADDCLFGNPQNTALASAMSFLSNTAYYIETTVNNCATLFDIEILILCRVKRQKDQDCITAKNFVLWNTLVLVKSPILFPNRTATEQPNDGPPVQDRNATAICKGARTVVRSRQASQSADKNNIEQAMAHPRSIEGRASDPGRAALVNQNTSSDEEYIVPVDVASECLRMLLDSSGFTSHRNCFQRASYTNLSSKILFEALQNILKAESNRRKQGKESSNQMEIGHAGVLTREQARKLKPKVDLIYTDLLPDQLRSSFCHDKISATVSMIKFSSSGGPSVTRNVKVGLKIRKPDRNKKNQNFALLCILLQFTKKDGGCIAVLRKCAKKDLSSVGCSRRMKFFTGQQPNCGGLDDCRSLTRKICNFFDEQKKRIGMGTVHSHVNNLNDYVLRENETVVRFVVIEKLLAQQAPKDVAMVLKHMDIPKNQHVIWKSL